MEVEPKGKKSPGDFPLVRRIGEPCACKRKSDLRRGAVLPETPQIPRGRVLPCKTDPKGLLGKSAASLAQAKKNRPPGGFLECYGGAAAISLS